MDEINLSGISKSFKFPVLRDVSARFAKGIHIIGGPNGCGKTTLLRIISGRLLPDTGTLSPTPEKVSSLFARQPFYPQLSLTSNIEFFVSLRGIKLSKETLLDFARISCLDEAELSKRAENISQGNLIKAGICKMYIEDSPVFLIDEGLSSLDSKSFEKNIEYLSACALKKVILIVSHQKERFMNLKPSFWEIREGKLYKNDY